VTLMLYSLPTPLQALALVTNQMLRLQHMTFIKNTIFLGGLIKVEPFSLVRPKMQLHFNWYIVFLGHFIMWLTKLKWEAKHMRLIL